MCDGTEPGWNNDGNYYSDSDSDSSCSDSGGHSGGYPKASKLGRDLNIASLGQHLFFSALSGGLGANYDAYYGKQSKQSKKDKTLTSTPHA